MTQYAAYITVTDMNDIYEALKTRNLCRRLQDFEEQWLGVCRRYLATYGDPSAPACTRLYIRLVESGPQQGDLAALVWSRMVSKLNEKENG
jgi:hypothetical protein